MKAIPHFGHFRTIASFNFFSLKFNFKMFATFVRKDLRIIRKIFADKDYSLKTYISLSFLSLLSFLSISSQLKPICSSSQSLSHIRQNCALQTIQSKTLFVFLSISNSIAKLHFLHLKKLKIQSDSDFKR